MRASRRKGHSSGGTTSIWDDLDGLRSNWGKPKSEDQDFGVRVNNQLRQKFMGFTSIDLGVGTKCRGKSSCEINFRGLRCMKGEFEELGF